MLCRAAFHFFWFERESVLMVVTWKIVNCYLTLRRKWNVNEGQPESVVRNLLIMFLSGMCFGRTWSYGYNHDQKSSEVLEKIESVILDKNLLRVGYKHFNLWRIFLHLCLPYK